MLNPLNKMTKRQIELLRDFGHLLREIREMTDDEARQILDRAESSEDDQPPNRDVQTPEASGVMVAVCGPEHLAAPAAGCLNQGKTVNKESKL
jgi:hypothetical protein